MRLTVFQSDKGDCVLLTAADGKRVLIDGGMRASYSEHVAPALGKLAKAKQKLDLVYVSHIDQDHISGVLQLFDDLVDWRVHDFQLRSGNADHPEPASPRPPEIGELWHNAFHEQVGENAGPIEEMLAATASVLEAGARAGDRTRADSLRSLATSVSEGIQLSRRAGAEQLDIPVNDAFDGRLAMVRASPRPIKLGSLAISVLGPRAADLDKLRREWNEWLAENQAALGRIRDRMRGDVERLGTTEVEILRNALELQAAELGERSKVTTPNLASLMLLVEEQGRTLLLTGDGHADDVVAGLEHVGALEEGQGLHVNVLKVQHHGSEHNIHAAFCKRVTADHYVFCANGAHENPDLRAVETIIDSRRGTESQRSTNPGAERRFKLWFNSSSTATLGDDDKAHMREVEKLVGRRSGGGMSSSLLKGHSFELRLS